MACLTCLGSVVSVQAPLVEVWQHLQSSKPRNTSMTSQPDSSPRDGLESGYHSNHGSASASSSDTGMDGAFSSGMVTPNLPSGCLTPTITDIQSQASEASWVVRMCVKNVAPTLLDTHDPSGDRSPRKPTHYVREGSSSMQPLPVRLESLQLMAQLTKGYFPVIR